MTQRSLGDTLAVGDRDPHLIASQTSPSVAEISASTPGNQTQQSSQAVKRFRRN